jgi:hypothetical protein
MQYGMIQEIKLTLVPSQKQQLSFTKPMPPSTCAA